MGKKQPQKLPVQLGTWAQIEVVEGEVSLRQVGPMTLAFRRAANEIWVAVDRSQMEKTDEDTLTWSRWALKQKDAQIQLLPIMPDRQVVVRPEFPFRLSSGATAKIFTRIPVWVGVYTTEIPVHKLTEIPSVNLSKTWFGDFLDGTLCYWISTMARREVTSDLYQPHTAISTLNIKNESDEDLHIDKLSIRVERLSLYIQGEQLWTDEMDIVYKGSDQHSEIRMTGKTPSEAKNAILITPPRDAVRHSFAERTFRILKEIPGFS